MKEEILRAIREKGLLLEKEIYDLMDGFEDAALARNFLEQLEKLSGQKLITKSVLNKNVGYVKEFVSQLPGEDKKVVEKVFVSLGLSLEVVREKEIVEDVPRKQDYQVFYSNTTPDKKLEVKDFTKHFRARFQQIQAILMERQELQRNLVSINKISSDRTSLSVIGIVTEKRITKNKNLIINLEDLTGQIKVLVKFRPENENSGEQSLFGIAEELQLDDIVGIKASGNSDILFVHEIFFPDSFIHEKVKFNEDYSVAFVSDLHCGNSRHLGKNFEKFLEWLNSDNPDVQKIRYIFFVGDNVDGVGVYPGQEHDLNLKSMEEQYELLISYLKKIPKRITMFMIPGQHDATRVAEPQPAINKNYAPGLYEIENLVLVTNPTMVKLLEGEKEFKILMYHGASIHTLINEIKTLRLMKAHQCPAKALEQMLKRRHLAPTHSEVVYIPNGKEDPLVISEVPDVFCTGEVHRLDITNYNGVLALTGSCWQAQTPFEEKVGNIPDPCKVPILNLKSRELKIFDFSDGEGG